LRRLAEVRKSGKEMALGPDAKSQLSVEYRDGVPVGVSPIVLSTQQLDENLESEASAQLLLPIFGCSQLNTDRSKISELIAAMVGGNYR